MTNTKKVRIEPSVGDRFGKLEILSSSKLLKGRRYISVVCDCGQSKDVRLDNLLEGRQVSCGCHRNAQNKVVNLSHGYGGRGENRHPMYRTWSDMIQRMTNPKSPTYNYYGGRGLVLDSTWLDFQNFLRDMESLWFPGGTLERVDCSKGYCKANCIWATQKEQMLNTRKSYLLKYHGEEYTVDEVASKFNIVPNVLRHKLNRHKGRTADEVIDSMLTGTWLKVIVASHVNKKYPQEAV